MVARDSPTAQSPTSWSRAQLHRAPGLPQWAGRFCVSLSLRPGPRLSGRGLSPFGVWLIGALLIAAVALVSGCKPAHQPSGSHEAQESQQDVSDGDDDRPQVEIGRWTAWLFNPATLLRGLGGLMILAGVIGTALSITSIWTRIQPVESLILVPFGTSLFFLAEVVSVALEVVAWLVWPVAICGVIAGLLWLIDVTDAAPRARGLWRRVRGKPATSEGSA